MKHRGLVVWVCVLLYVSAAQAAPLSNLGGAATDLENEKAIRKLYAEFTATWNRHDAPALAAMWAIDGDHLEPDGTRVKGRKAVLELMKRQHDTAFRDSILKLDIQDVWFTTREVALIDGDYQLSGVRLPNGAELPARDGHLTAILLKEQNQWWIAASRLMVPTGLPYKK